jgi:hypothetical protein
MKAVSLLLLLILLPLCAAAKGKTDNSAGKPINTDWTVVITAADISALPTARAAVGTYWNRELARSIRYIQYRVRGEDEMNYYTGNEWLKNQTKAAKDIKSKQNERDDLYYKGLADWQYKQQVKKIDDDIKKLRVTLDTAEKTKPIIEKLPKFNITTQNASGEFAQPPRKGGEMLFCTSQKADAFIASTISIYHERIYIELRLWTLYSKSYSYTDGIVFSLEDIDAASDEIIARLVDAMTGVYPTMLHVKTNPETAVIVVDGNFEGQGESGNVPHSPGDAEIMVFAPHYETARATVPLYEGDLTSVTLGLSAVPDMGFDVSIRHEIEASVYSGALYVGEAPARITAAEDSTIDINVITPEGKTAGTVFKISEKPLTLNPQTPPKKNRVEKARKGFYGAWGRLWIILPLTWLAMGISDSYVYAYNNSGSSNDSDRDKVMTVYWAAGGMGILAGLFALESIGRFLWYGYQADRPVTPLDPK